MTRALYRCLVWLHPPVFRREFAGEMLWIYEESAHSGGAMPLVYDALASLARQWVLRSGYWKYAAAALGAMVQVTGGGILMFRLGLQAPDQPTITAAGNPELAALMRLAAFTAIGLLAAVMFLVIWWRMLARRKGV